MDKKRREGIPSKNYLLFILKENKSIACFLCYKLIIRGGFIMFDKFPDIVNVKDVCKMLHISKNTVYELIRSGRLPAKRIGRIYRIRKADVILFTAS